MKKTILFLLLILGVTFSYAQKRSAIHYDKMERVKKGEIKWWGYKVVKSEYSSHTGAIPLKLGKFYFDNKKLVGGEFLIDMRKLTNTDLRDEEHDLLDKHLKSSDFFDVRKYPMAKFVISKLVPQKHPEYNYEVIGHITIKGVRKTISFPAQIIKDDYAVTFKSAKFSLNRHDFNVFYNYSVKDYFIKDEMDIQVEFSTIQ